SLTVTTAGRRNAVRNPRSGAQRLCDRREDSRVTAEEEDGPGRARPTLRAVARLALEAGNGAPVSDAAHAAAYRVRLQCRARLFLRRRAREAARGGRPQGGPRAGVGAVGWGGPCLPL